MITVDRINGVTGDLAIKTPVRVATTANITLEGLQTIDGVLLVADDRVLVKNQTTAASNGIWIANTSAWSRALDFDGRFDAVRGTLVEVVAGTLEAGSVFRLDTDSPVIGTTSLTFTRTHTVNLEADLASTANGKGAAMVGRAEQIVESITALRALIKTSASIYAFVTGIGHYRLDAADTTSADTGGSVIVATDGGRWKLLHDVVTSGHFYDEFGAIIGRFGDRLLVGDAVKNGANTASQPDWLTTYQLAKGRSFGYIQSTQAAFLNGLGAELTGAQNTFLAGAQTSNLTDGFNAIGVLGIAVANKTSGAGNAYAGYYEAFRSNSAIGGAYGIEIDTVNYQASSATNPYAQAADQVVALQLAAGAEMPAGGQFSAAAAINIRNNNSTFDRAMVVGANALSGCDGVTGTAVAIGMAKGHQIQWYAAGDVLTSSIECVGTTAAGGSKQRIGNSFVNWLNDANLPVAQLTWPASAVNYPSLRASVTGNAVQLVIEGSDTNIDLQIMPKGTGAIWLGTWTSNADAAINGYVTVKDSSGNVRKIATIA